LKSLPTRLDHHKQRRMQTLNSTYACASQNMLMHRCYVFNTICFLPSDSHNQKIKASMHALSHVDLYESLMLFALHTLTIRKSKQACTHSLMLTWYESMSMYQFPAPWRVPA
jgi:hypothetical protein